VTGIDFDTAVVVGLGGIGLPFAVALAGRGVRVTGFDCDAAKVARLAAGVCDLLDEGLESAFRAALASGALTVADHLAPADRPRAYVICAPTPVDPETERFDPAALEAAMASVAAAARDGDLVMIRSTVPVGTLRRFAGGMSRTLLFAACPDRTLAGRAYAGQFASPHLVGGLTAEAAEAAAALMGRLGPVARADTPETAEAAKLFSNVWRDARFALANQLALWCEAAGLDYEAVRAAAGDGYPAFDAPRAGPVGGPCLTKDVFLLAEGGDAGLLLEARRVNQGLAEYVAGQVLATLGVAGGPENGDVAVLGLAFKGAPPTRDRRAAFGPDLIAALGRQRPDLAVRAWDPLDDDGRGAAETLAGAAVVVLANDHPALAAPALYAACRSGAVIFDACGVLRGGEAGLRADLTVRRLGRGARG
jgi:UDP-N-acetyl-D-mannosaminuronic acid dehydrogenase